MLLVVLQVAAEGIVRALGVTDGPGFDALMEALTDGNGSTSTTCGEYCLCCTLSMLCRVDVGTSGLGRTTSLCLGCVGCSSGCTVIPTVEVSVGELLPADHSTNPLMLLPPALCLLSC